MASQSGSHEQQGGHAIGVREREVDRELAAERASHEYGAAAARAVDDREQLTDAIDGDIAGRRRAAAGPIEAHDTPKP